MTPLLMPQQAAMSVMGDLCGLYCMHACCMRSGFVAVTLKRLLLLPQVAIAVVDDLSTYGILHGGMYV